MRGYHDDNRPFVVNVTLSIPEKFGGGVFKSSLPNGELTQEFFDVLKKLN